MPSALKPRGSATRRATAFEKAVQNNQWVSANIVRAKSQFTNILSNILKLNRGFKREGHHIGKGVLSFLCGTALVCDKVIGDGADC